MDIVDRPFAKTDIVSLALTLNIRRCGLECLTSETEGQVFRSQDQPAGDETPAQVKQQIDAVYNRINRRPTGHMASLAARRPQSFRSDNNLLSSYGDIVLLIDWEEVAPDIVVFNGDVKNLGAMLIAPLGSGEGRNDLLISFGFDAKHRTEQIESTCTALDELWARTTKIDATPPRIFGKYCEARLFRPLRPTDISKVFIPGTGSSERNLVEKLGRLKESMRKG